MPFPSNIEGCEALLDEYRRPQRYGLLYAATHTVGDMSRSEENFDMILPPFHINSLFTARDALIGVYGDSRRKNSQRCPCLPCKLHQLALIRVSIHCQRADKVITRAYGRA